MNKGLNDKKPHKHFHKTTPRGAINMKKLFDNTIMVVHRRQLAICYGGELTKHA